MGTFAINFTEYSCTYSFHYCSSSCTELQNCTAGHRSLRNWTCCPNYSSDSLFQAHPTCRGSQPLLATTTLFFLCPNHCSQHWQKADHKRTCGPWWCCKLVWSHHSPSRYCKGSEMWSSAKHISLLIISFTEEVGFLITSTSFDHTCFLNYSADKRFYLIFRVVSLGVIRDKKDFKVKVH